VIRANDRAALTLVLLLGGCGKVTESSAGAGACGACQDGVCRAAVLASGSFWPSIGQDGTSLYAVRDAVMLRISKSDGQQSVLADAPAGTAMSLCPGCMLVLSASQQVYWTGVGGVHSISAAGGPVALLDPEPAAGAASIARVGSNLYVPGSNGSDGKGDAVEGVFEIRVAGGGRKLVWSAIGGNLPFEPTWVSAWDVNTVILGGGSGAMVTQDTDRPDAPATVSVLTPAGAQTDLADALGGWGLTVENATAFYADVDASSSNVAIRSLALPGGKPARLVGLPLGCAASALAADATHVYVAACQVLYAIPRASPSLVKLADAPGTDKNTRLLVDDCAVYWVAPGGVMRLAKPG
jgi:hypothetical protein